MGSSSGGTHLNGERRAPRDGVEIGACSPRLLAGDTYAGDTFACQRRSFPDGGDHDSDSDQAARQSRAAAGAAYPSSRAQSPSLNRSIVYRSSSGDERGRAAVDATGRRRRPASAAPPRSRATHTYDRFRSSAEGGGSSEGGTERGPGRVSVGDPARGRPIVRVGGRGVQRPRSASATTGRRGSVSDVGTFAPFCTDAARSSPSAARRRPQSASAPAAAVPSFVVSEKQVLRFFGHLTEELDWGCGRSAGRQGAGELSSPILKIRQVVLHLYLSDGSLEMFEKRQVGSDLKLLGRSYRLTGCDVYTRKWYENEGFHQPEDQEAPEEINQCLRVEDTTGLCNKPQRPHTAARQAEDHRAWPRPTSQAMCFVCVSASVNRFFRHDKETLRFKVVWDDPSYGGTRRRYDLLLFLEDETVSLLNPREDHRNSGRDESMVHVRRQRLPKDWKARSDVYSGGEGGEANGDGGDGSDAFVGELDLAVGRTVHVWGREMKLVGCDPFTQAYYRKAAVVGTDYLTASLGQYEGGAPSGAFPVDRYRGHRIRCKAVLKSNMPNDKGREFVVTYDLALDTLMVYELQRRNSGRPGGLFLVKGKHRRPDKNNRAEALTHRAHHLKPPFFLINAHKYLAMHPSRLHKADTMTLLTPNHKFTDDFLGFRYYVPQDLFLGAVVPLVTGHTLVITEMDRSSLALCEQNPREFPLMDAQRVLGRVVQRARNMRLALRSELRRRAAGPVRSNASPFRASSGGGGGGGGGGIIAPSSIPMTSAAAAAKVSSWPAGKVLTNTNGASGNPRHDQPRTHPSTAVMTETSRQGPVTSGRATGSGAPHNGKHGAPTGRRARSEATWGLVGGWGDSFASTSQAQAGVENAPGKGGSSSSSSERHVVVKAQPSCEYGYYRRGGGNPKNESATAPWAAVQAAGVNVFAPNSGQAGPAARSADTGGGVGSGATRTRRSGEDHSDPYSFEDHAAFRDAMDDLGLLVGLGQQEVLTMVRAFTGKRGKRVDWASMCDRMSQTSAATKTTLGQDGPGARDTTGGAIATGRTPYSPQEPCGDDTTAMRRNGLAIGAGDAAFLARRFARGGGSQVDYHRLCDKIYPCDFSTPPTSSSPNSEDEGCERGFFLPSSPSHPPRPPSNVRHAPRGHLDYYCQSSSSMARAGRVVSTHDAGADGGRGPSGGGGRGDTLGFGEDRRARAPTCDSDLGGGGGNGGGDNDGGGGGGGGGDSEYGGGGSERAWSLWDRKEYPPEQRCGTFGRSDGDGRAKLGGAGGNEGSSQYWGEDNAMAF
eukprot:g15991.t1